MTVGKFLDPKNDFAFKRIFGTEKNKDILIHFLNNVLHLREADPITEVTFLRPSQDPDIASKKQSIVDVLCKDATDRQFIVEMQVCKTDGFEKRAQYYAAKAYINQLDKGGEYNTLNPVIFLAIVNFTMFPKKTSYRSDHDLRDRETLENDLKGFAFTFFELSKFNQKIEELSTSVEKWAYFFKHAEETTVGDLDKISGTDLVIKKAYEQLDASSWTEGELLAYEAVLKIDRDNRAAELARFKDAVAEGEARGEARGEAKGLAKGKTEVAKELLSMGITVEQVAAATKLDIATINTIAEELDRDGGPLPLEKIRLLT